MPLGSVDLFFKINYSLGEKRQNLLLPFLSLLTILPFPFPYFFREWAVSGKLLIEQRAGRQLRDEGKMRRGKVSRINSEERHI